MANPVYQFLVSFPDEEKLRFSRETYRALMSDEDFAKAAPLLCLGAECDVNDRFLFLYVLSAMKTEMDEYTFGEYASILLMMREVSFTLLPSSTATHGVAIHPDLSRWSSGEADDGKEWFTKTWTFLPEDFRAWMQDAFARLPENFAKVAA